MNHEMKKRLLQQLMDDEGFSLEPYKDTVGALTIGYGRNLDAVGIDKDEAAYLLRNDLKRALHSLDRHLPWWRDLSQKRQCAMANMTFNLGIIGLLNFKKMLTALKKRDYSLAADEALDSKWATQVGSRADRIANLIRQG